MSTAPFPAVLTSIIWSSAPLWIAIDVMGAVWLCKSATSFQGSLWERLREGSTCQILIEPSAEPEASTAMSLGGVDRLKSSAVNHLTHVTLSVWPTRDATMRAACRIDGCNCKTNDVIHMM